jgi:ceramide glucosyltransferase
MDWYFYIALAAILPQLLSLLQSISNYHFARSKLRKKRSWQLLHTVLIVPCKGLDSEFHKNIASFFNQNYDNYVLWFVVDEKSDPAYDELQKLREQLASSSKAQDVQIFVAGHTDSCSQKIHNLLYCYNLINSDVDVLAFADSDICVPDYWLRQLVWPLRLKKNGAASGYRWFIPRKNNLATLALSALNARVAQLLGNTPFNQAWGGSMAIRADDFRRLGLDKIWQTVLSDDFSLSRAVKKAGLIVAFVPTCLAASYETTTWRGLLEFCRRQLLITRVYAPLTWSFGLLTSLYSALGLWGGAAFAFFIAIYHVKFHIFNFQFSAFPLAIAVPIIFFVSQLFRAIMRWKMVAILLPNDIQQLKIATTIDILAFWLWSLLLLFCILTSAFGRTIRWRGIRYKLVSPTKTIILQEQ